MSTAPSIPSGAAELRAIVHVTRAGTGQVDTYQLTMRPGATAQPDEAGAQAPQPLPPSDPTEAAAP